MATKTYPYQAVPESEMEREPSRPDGRNWICNVLYDIYHMTNREDIRLKLRIAMGMAQSMNRRLREYHRETGHS